MSTFTPKRPESRQKDRYSPTGANVTTTRSVKGSPLPGTLAYGIQEIPVKRPLRTEFEKTKADLNRKASVPRLGKNCQRREEVESNRPSPIAMNPIAPSKSSRATPTYKSSPDNPLARTKSHEPSRSNVLQSSMRFAARRKFEASRANSTAADENKFAGQWEACRNVKNAKTKETSVLKEHPHGATQGIIYHKRPEGLTLPGLGFGRSCRS